MSGELMKVPRFRLWFDRSLRQTLLAICIMLAAAAGCSPAPAEQEASPSPAASQATEHPTATTAIQTPSTAGWITETRSGACPFHLSHPPGMEAASEGDFSQSFSSKAEAPPSAAASFVYVSVVNPEISSLIEQGQYDFEVYNFDPAEAAQLRSLQVGESISVNPVAEMAQWFTFERLPDREINGQLSLAFVNRQPWEFPEGILELRYLLTTNDCTYQIGAYLASADSGQTDAMTEDLLSRMVETFSTEP
jgi:hypothetical protein